MLYVDICCDPKGPTQALVFMQYPVPEKGCVGACGTTSPELPTLDLFLCH